MENQAADGIWKDGFALMGAACYKWRGCLFASIAGAILADATGFYTNLRRHRPGNIERISLLRDVAQRLAVVQPGRVRCHIRQLRPVTSRQQSVAPGTNQRPLRLGAAR